MAFTNELISDADKHRIDWTTFRAWAASPPHGPWKWTIDRERDVFFVRLEGPGPDAERPETYALCWRGNLIRVEADVTARGEFKTGVDATWNVRKLDTPPELAASREEIVQLLREAIQAFGLIYEPERVRSVLVNVA